LGEQVALLGGNTLLEFTQAGLELVEDEELTPL